MTDQAPLPDIPDMRAEQGLFLRGRQDAYPEVMKRLLVLSGGLYLLAALWGLARESNGTLRCDCNEDCWCKTPGPSLFRWVLPVGHSLPDSQS